MTNRLFLLAAGVARRGTKLTAIFKDIAMQGMPFETSGTRDVYDWMVRDFESGIPEAQGDIDAWAAARPIEEVRAALTKVAERDDAILRAAGLRRTGRTVHESAYGRLGEDEKATAIASAARILGVA
ncbi:hypothetical protein HOU00_gp231 [Caulobacter phage CcrPW]|uniref:Uncharacterized protein n=1 Tax=Caulobacter phage CcrPW TaxID=2283271 RepID=A0A385EAK8_9CAUD|nr:hypothetical protein HOU00_gp231 [Caulobacter phage CcrPW]AXQ68894.1 hypothetical protein CcrPW_gp355 [Caulobacter phage CcrPW]